MSPENEDAFDLLHRRRLEVHHGENELGEPVVTVLPPNGSFAEAPCCDAYDIEAFRRTIVRAAAMTEGD